ncbi:MAG TPA: DNRLRE domain-containing protein [Tepidisphaeraceae bacterium]|nr:DNRLRE domain-containing protein [Tepidisphaeraceae bacterium]
MVARIYLVIGAAVWAAALAATTPARADVATIGASRDNTIFESNNNSLGGGQAMFIGTNGMSLIRRGLIAFDLPGSIPAGSTINSVQLTLFLNQVPGGGTGSPTIRLFRVSADWGEGIAGNGTSGATGAGQGFAAGAGDATWNARHYSATTPTLWNTQGGDFAAIESASRAIVGTTLNAPYSWQSTPGLVADVQSWLDAPAGNFGWILRSDEVNAQTVRGFWTREAARTNQSAFSPQLQVTFTPVPEPAAMMLVLAGFLAGIRRRSG